MTEHQLRLTIVFLVSFLTLVDLFATQAIVPRLAAHYSISPAAMGVAVNASTIGMAISGIAVALLGNRIERRRGIVVSLVILSIPTALLATMPDLSTFFYLRIAQGILMSAAFTLTMAYLAENFGRDRIAAALAAYVTGNVASNFLGRLLSSGLTDHFGLATNFVGFALLNLTGALLVYLTFVRFTTVASAPAPERRRVLEELRSSYGERRVLQSFAIGFLILFVFVGTFTYVNFVLVRPPISLSQMSVGFAYMVFLPALITTPLVGRVQRRIGVRAATQLSFILAVLGLFLTLFVFLKPVLIGLSLIAVGLFAAQALVTGFVSRIATRDAASASGGYLASYYFGGLAGSALLGLAFDHFGWPGCVAGMGVALVVAISLASRLIEATPVQRSSAPQSTVEP